VRVTQAGSFCAFSLFWTTLSEVHLYFPNSIPFFRKRYKNVCFSPTDLEVKTSGLEQKQGMNMKSQVPHLYNHIPSFKVAISVWTHAIIWLSVPQMT
jgi:hypothetical protein